MLPFQNLSFWEKENYLNRVDFLIIGSGIVGLSTAIYLREKHPEKKILVVERGYLPTGASTKNAGFACIGSASELLDDLSHSSEKKVFETLEKRWKGLQNLRSLLGDDKIDYYSLGSHELFRAKEKSEYENCLNQLSYLNRQLEQITGLKENHAVARSVIRTSGFQGFQYALSNKAEGQINTGKMMSALVQFCYSKDISVLNGITVNSIDSKSVNTSYGNIAFDKLALCTNGLAAQFLPEENIEPVRAQVIVTSQISNLKVKGTFHFDKGYYYFRNIDNRVLFGGGRNLDFKAEETDELNTSDQIINHLSSILESQILPESAFTIDHQWAGTMGVGQEKSPVIKQIDTNFFCGVRLGGMGVAIGTLVGKELADLMDQTF